MKAFEKMPWLFEAVGGLPTMSMTDVCQILQIKAPFPTLFSSPERLGDVKKQTNKSKQTKIKS